MAAHCTAVLRHDTVGQETLLNLLLRNYLHYNLYDQVSSPALHCTSAVVLQLCHDRHHTGMDFECKTPLRFYIEALSRSLCHIQHAGIGLRKVLHGEHQYKPGS
jgi:hypothetical protein